MTMIKISKTQIINLMGAREDTRLGVTVITYQAVVPNTSPLESGHHYRDPKTGIHIASDFYAAAAKEEAIPVSFKIFSKALAAAIKQNEIADFSPEKLDTLVKKYCPFPKYGSPDAKRLTHRKNSHQKKGPA